MIRKIKKFKISVRPFGVLRQLKKKSSLEPGKEPQDAALESEISKVQAHLVPCALYATFSKDQTPQLLKPLWQSSPEKSLSMSVILATIGKAIEGEIEKKSLAKDASQTALLDSIARESLEQSFHFVSRIINEEAQEDSCEMTPFLPVGSDALKDTFDVLEAQKAAIAKVRAGCHWNDPHDAAVRAITRGLVRIGLLKGQTTKLIKDGAYRRFFMHRTGHWLGMDVHDVGEYKVGEQWRLLEPGMVTTVEPGIYIAPGSKGVGREWWGIGVRIEDDVVVTQGDAEVLSAAMPSDPDEIERLMAAA